MAACGRKRRSTTTHTIASTISKLAQLHLNVLLQRDTYEEDSLFYSTTDDRLLTSHKAVYDSVESRMQMQQLLSLLTRVIVVARSPS